MVTFDVLFRLRGFWREICEFYLIFICYRSQIAIMVLTDREEKRKKKKEKILPSNSEDLFDIFVSCT